MARFDGLGNYQVVSEMKTVKLACFLKIGPDTAEGSYLGCPLGSEWRHLAKQGKSMSKPFCMGLELVFKL